MSWPSIGLVDCAGAAVQLRVPAGAGSVVLGALAVHRGRRGELPRDLRVSGRFPFSKDHDSHDKNLHYSN